ncbi:MAG TPA: LytTR family DNA-binding domain-containing protein [Gemmatimonadaceae bacterium]
MAEHPPLRVLIVDDEPLGRQRVAALLRKEPGVEIVGLVGDGASAVEAIRSSSPDLVFLDVQMPGMTGLEVVRSVGASEMPTTVFVTAYDRHALEAFDLAAVDYLVKPFDDERFEQAFQRARRIARLEQGNRLREMLLAVLQETDGAAPRTKTPAEARSRYLERIAVESRGKVRFIPVADVDYILASGPYAELVVGDRKHLIREAMQHLEDQLDPARFFRVHRSAIVQLDRVDALLRSAGGDYEVQLRNGVKLRVARSRREELEKQLAR